MNKSILALCALTLLIGVTNAQAVIVSYSNRTTFNAAAGAVTTQSFNTFAPGNAVFKNVAFDFGDFSALNAGSAGEGDIVSPGLVNGSTEILAVTQVGGAELKFTFDYPITALGFDAYQLADQRFHNLLFNNASGDIVPIFDPIDQTRFWGFISNTSFTSFTIRQTGQGVGGGPTDGFFIDDVTYSSSAAVPEVSSFLLVGLFGLAMLGIAKLRNLMVRGSKRRSHASIAQ